MKKIAYNMTEVSKMTGLSRSMVFKEIKAGNLVTSRIGERHLITEDELVNWLEAAKGKKNGTTT